MGLDNRDLVGDNSRDVGRDSRDVGRYNSRDEAELDPSVKYGLVLTLAGLGGGVSHRHH